MTLPHLTNQLTGDSLRRMVRGQQGALRVEPPLRLTQGPNGEQYLTLGSRRTRRLFVLTSPLGCDNCTGSTADPIILSVGISGSGYPVMTLPESSTSPQCSQWCFSGLVEAEVGTPTTVEFLDPDGVVIDTVTVPGTFNICQSVPLAGDYELRARVTGGSQNESVRFSNLSMDPDCPNESSCPTCRSLGNAAPVFVRNDGEIYVRCCDREQVSFLFVEPWQSCALGVFDCGLGDGAEVCLCEQEANQCGASPCIVFAADWNPDSRRWESDYRPPGVVVGRPTQTISPFAGITPGCGFFKPQYLAEGDCSGETSAGKLRDMDESPNQPVFNVGSEITTQQRIIAIQDMCCNWWAIVPGGGGPVEPLDCQCLVDGLGDHPCFGVGETLNFCKAIFEVRGVRNAPVSGEDGIPGDTGQGPNAYGACEECAFWNEEWVFLPTFDESGPTCNLEVGQNGWYVPQLEGSGNYARTCFPCHPHVDDGSLTPTQRSLMNDTGMAMQITCIDSGTISVQIRLKVHGCEIAYFNFDNIDLTDCENFDQAGNLLVEPTSIQLFFNATSWNSSNPTLEDCYTPAGKCNDPLEDFVTVPPCDQSGVATFYDATNCLWDLDPMPRLKIYICQNSAFFPENPEPCV